MKSDATPAKSWNYSPAAENRRQAQASVISGAIFAGTLATIFNPLALGASAIFGLGAAAHHYHKFNGKNALQHMYNTGYITALPRQHQHLQDYVDELARIAGTPPQTLVLAQPKILDFEKPWYLRLFQQKKKYNLDALASTAFAIPGMNIIGMTEEFIERSNERELRYVLAHELAHTKVRDHVSAYRLIDTWKKKTEGALYGVTALAIASSAFGYTTPIFLGGQSLFNGACTLVTIAITTGMGLNYASRMAEYRADRNAMYLTRDPGAAESRLLKTTLKGVPPPRDSLPDTHTHPSYHNRIDNLRASFTKAITYPTPATAYKPGHEKSAPAERSRPFLF